LLRRCAAGELDVGVLALPVKAGYLEVEPLFEEALHVVLPRDHPLAGEEELDIQLLKGEPFVLLGEAHCLSGTVQGFCRQNAFQPIVSGRLNQLATVQELVALGQGLSLVPEMARRVDGSTQRVYRAVKAPAPRRTVAACWNAYRYQSKLTRRFLELLRAEGAECAKRGGRAAEAGMEA
jgi:LysR family hydrogen peroxide-inducible transcriptional activator